METRVWQRRIAILFVFLMIRGKPLSSAATADPSRVLICPRESVVNSMLGFLDRSCIAYDTTEYPAFIGVTEGDEVSLLKAMNMVHKNRCKYVAVLFYASWCPFSRNFRPSFSLLSSLYPSIPHFAIEESSIRPSILSKYGVHGFPTLLLLHSTMRDRYHGSRTLGSLVAFYTDVTGIETTSLHKGSLDKIVHREKHDTNEQESESCPFSWARSPENLFRQETYLALATAFVLLRLVYLFFPALLVFAKFAWGWGRHIQNWRVGSLLERPRAYLNQIIQVFNSLKVPCRKSNLQGAISARAWASKSLVTVSIGDASTSRGAHSRGERH